MLVYIKDGLLFFGNDVIFSNLNFTINENEKIAIIGRNGCGKTSFLNVIEGKLELISGTISKSNKCTIASLKQSHNLDDNLTVIEEYLKVFKDLLELEKQLEDLNIELTKYNDLKLVEKFGQIQSKFEQLGGYTYMQDIKTIIHGFGFLDEDLNRKISTFSGGQKTKLSFGKILLTKPDLLLLDEPTNHLDLETILWLEDYLSKYKSSLIVVSHDRTFIDNVCNVIYDFEYGQLTKYVGKYQDYLDQKKNNYERQLALYNLQQKDIKRIETLIEKFRYKANKASFAQSKIKYLDRMTKIEKPTKADENTFNAKFEVERKGGKSVLTLENYCVGYDKKLFEIDLNIEKGQRICVMGKNGCGKSTLLKTIVEKIKPLSGYKLFGFQIDVGYFDQELANIETNKTVLDELWDLNKNLDHKVVRGYLGSFLFTGDDVFKTCDVLSGGEKVRLSLLKLMLKKANFLILDEPTNHLDIISKEALEKALLDFEGTILFVSHDRYFIKKIATECLLIENGQAILYKDGYKDYIDVKKSQQKKFEEHKIETFKQKKKDKPKYDIKKVEAKLIELEEEISLKRELRYEPEYYQDMNKMKLLDEEIDDLNNQIKNLEIIWESLFEQ